MGNRLCTSLKPEFDIDAVFLGAGDNAAVEEAVRETRERMPWLHNLFFIRSVTAKTKTPPPPGTFLITEAEFLAREDAARGIPPEALLHALPQLSDYYLVFPPGRLPESTPDPLDCYTPNGIPLIPSSLLPEGIQEIMDEPDPLAAWREISAEHPLWPRTKGRPAPYAQTRDNSLAFYSFLDAQERTGPALSDDDYGNLLRQWLYLTGRGIPAGGARP